MARLYSISGVLQNAVSATGNGTVFDVSGLSTVGVEISGTFVATLTFQGRIAGGTWYAVQAENINSGVVGSTSTAVGLFRVPVAGLDEFRVAVTWSSGTSVTVTVTGTVAASGVTLADVDIVTGETIVLGAGSAAIGKLAANSGVDIGDVDVLSLPSLAAGTNAIGKLAANSGVDIGDVDVTSLPTSIQGPGNPTVDSYAHAVVDLAASTADQVLVAAPGANKQIWVYGLAVLANTAAGTFVLQDEDNTALSGTLAVSDEGGIVMPVSGNFAMPWIKLATNKALECDTGACTLDGVLTYGIISV